MKPILKTLCCGFVLISSTSWALTDLSISDFPSTLNFTGFNMVKTSGGTFDPSTSEWNKVRSWDYGPGYRGVNYRIPSAGADPNYVAVDGAHTEVGFLQSGGQVGLTVSSRDATTGAVLFEAYYSGPSLSELTLQSSVGVNGPPATFNPTWFANGLSPSGGSPVGGAYSPPGGGGGDVIVNQAKELTQGLSFQGGDWIPNNN